MLTCCFNIAEQLRAFVEAAPSTKLVIYDPIVEQRKKDMEGPKSKAFERTIESRTQDFAKTFGLKPGNITVAITPEMVADSFESKGRAH